MRGVKGCRRTTSSYLQRGGHCGELECQALWDTCAQSLKRMHFAAHTASCVSKMEQCSTSAPLNAYEQERQDRIERNRQFLAQLGIQTPTALAGAPKTRGGRWLCSSTTSSHDVAACVATGWCELADPWHAY
jgi:hypothetical protein